MPPKKSDEGKQGGRKKLGNTEIHFKGFNWKKLIKELKSAQTRQRNVKKEIENLMPQYVHLSEDQRKDFLNDGGRALRKDTRGKAAYKVMDLQQRLEDFLFYQNSVNRWKRYYPLRATKKEREEGKKVNKQPMLIEHRGEDRSQEAYYFYLREMLQYYDLNGIGLPEYRHQRGGLDATEESASEPSREIELGPGYLHLWTPPWRRVPVGLREEAATEDLERELEDPIRIRVNEEAIEARREEFENIVDDDVDLEYRTHTERRAAELEAYADTRPSTANIFVRTNAEGGQIDEDRFRRIQTASGVFLAALESSHDWLTSYDCLGLVKVCGIPEHFETSAVRDEDRFYDSPDEDEDFNAPFDPPSDEMEGGNDGEHGEGIGPANDGANDDLEDDGGDDLPLDGDGEAPQATAMSGEEPDDNGRQLRNGKQLSSSPMPKAKRVKIKTGGARANTVSKGTGNDAGPAKGSKKKGASKPTSGDGTKEPTEDESRERVTASIDYPYNKREFCLPKKTRRVNEGRLPSTVWAEATDGRRERHVGMIKRPYSPVNSPPHSPIDPDAVDISTIPDGNGVPNEPKLRRCKHGNAICRAWWPHATDECWSLHEEPTSLPTNRMEIDAPVMLDVPEGSQEAQHEKIKWNMDPDPTDSGDEYDEGDEGDSDDEDDLFRMSYEQGSFPNGRPAPVIPPTMAPGPTAPDDTATANAATEGVVPAEDNPVDDGAEDL
ncbi:hypothetical protein J4E80_009596 [Alternaria sp. BMP 0032]|nr:hypothetical protein J4E80_009596 [Alternaria sp. BMP 0032]